MTIEHQIVTDEEGNPTAALIPWREFEAIVKDYEESDEPTPEEAEALAQGKEDRDSGNDDAYMDLDAFMDQFTSSK
ncbi:MAG: hypothetical protein AAF226_13305 [Verrucomicrobiota bacterium]